MTIKFHPDENTLAEYASGVIDSGLAIAVKAHLDMCPQCRNRTKELKLVGASFFEQTTETTNNEYNEAESFSKLMARIKQMATQPTDSTQDAAKDNDATRNLPSIVSKLLAKQGKLNWQFVSPSLRQANLVTGQDKYEVCLHKIKRGGKVVEHDHQGRELTVVLEGSFSDESGTYRKGDFILRAPGDKHRPTATQDQDCLCLSVVEAPVKLTGFFGKLINPFLSISPA